MDVREKLVELLQDQNNPVWRWFPNNMAMMQLAYYLIESGVTVQEWVSAKNRLPNEPMKCLVYTKRGEYWGYEITYYNQGFYTQYAEAIYWMPIPQPPKGK